MPFLRFNYFPLLIMNRFCFFIPSAPLSKRGEHRENRFRACAKMRKNTAGKREWSIKTKFRFVPFWSGIYFFK